MKKRFLACFMLFCSFSGLAQEGDLKEKKAALNDQAVLIYHINNHQEKTGPFYIKSPKSEQVLLKGAYTNNKRTGNWYFYGESGKLETVYSYQQNKLAFIDSTLLSRIIINIPGQSKEVSENATIPVMLSPMHLFLREVTQSLKIPQEHFDGTNPLQVHVRAEISPKGDTKYSVIYDLKGEKIAIPVKLKKTAFDIEWIPSYYNNQPMKSEFIVSTSINPPQEDGQSRFIWNY